MLDQIPIQLSGVPGSPYTRKMLALLRYRRLAYRFHANNSPPKGFPRPKVQLLPTFYLPAKTGDLEAVVDSTPIIRRLERDFVGREVRPPDPVLGLISDLLEDYGDEWLTKAMFHYRWVYPADIKQARDILPCWTQSQIPDADLNARRQMIAERQISRLHVVGSNPVTGPVIEESYVRLLDMLEAHFRDHRFLLGARPSAADFAIYGQLTQLTHFDPTPMALCLARAQRVYAWVDLMEDLSGLEVDEGGWLDTRTLPQTLLEILAEVGRTYVPVMLANEAALATGAEAVDTTVEGRTWTQPPFAYQAKCLQSLRSGHGALGGADRILADQIMVKANCSRLFANS